MIIGHVDKGPRYIQACSIYAEVLEMAAILDWADTRRVACIRSEREFGNGRHVMGDAIVGAPGSASIMDYIRLHDFWRSVDFTDSVRDAQAFLEICLCISSRAHIE